MSAFPVHLQMLGVWIAMISKLCSLSYFWICFSRIQTGPYPFAMTIFLLDDLLILLLHIHCVGVLHIHFQWLLNTIVICDGRASEITQSCTLKSNQYTFENSTLDCSVAVKSMNWNWAPNYSHKNFKDTLSTNTLSTFEYPIPTIGCSLKFGEHVWLSACQTCTITNWKQTPVLSNCHSRTEINNIPHSTATVL